MKRIELDLRFDSSGFHRPETAPGLDAAAGGTETKMIERRRNIRLSMEIAGMIRGERRTSVGSNPSCGRLTSVSTRTQQVTIEGTIDPH
jgi:hypothetical protein